MATTDSIDDQILATWRRHNRILLFLLDHIPAGGETAAPSQSRGRTVAEQFAHLQRVRAGWLEFHLTGKRPGLPKSEKGNPAPLPAIRGELEKSAEAIEQLLANALQGKADIRMFGKSPVRWMGYLISHESHHRGQILLALKQAGLRTPAKVALDGLWGEWIMGK